MKKIFILVLLSLLALPLTAKSFKLNPGQYVYFDGEIKMLSNSLERIPHGFRIQPLASIGLAPSFLTAVRTNASGKWEAVFFVAAEKSSFETKYQLAPGDLWTLYLVQNTGNSIQSRPITLKVESIKNNEVEVSVVELPK
ncbi:hypothetical protein [uncultured Treponema sp.]|uniref:hypothetical protein n=1 Tax=uncultured Treponema sp. TaxID=162155 RepID=UPI0025E89C68|nr:hypothetical protein [uncultured Treponema sp.]